MWHQSVNSPLYQDNDVSNTQQRLSNLDVVFDHPVEINKTEVFRWTNDASTRHVLPWGRGGDWGSYSVISWRVEIEPGRNNHFDGSKPPMPGRLILGTRHRPTQLVH